MSIYSETATRIEALFEFAFNNPDNECRIIDVFQIEEPLSTWIFSKTGIDVDKFWVSIDNYSIVHTLTRHGNPEKEANHGQTAISKTDFIKIGEIISSPDTVTLDTRIHKNNRQKQTLVFSKKLENYYFIAKEVRRVSKKGKINRLVLQTMYIRKKQAGHTTLL